MVFVDSIGHLRVLSCENHLYTGILQIGSLISARVYRRSTVLVRFTRCRQNYSLVTPSMQIYSFSLHCNPSHYYLRFSCIKSKRLDLAAADIIVSKSLAAG
jgi:hypothetical protein